MLSKIKKCKSHIHKEIVFWYESQALSNDLKIKLDVGRGKRSTLNHLSTPTPSEGGQCGCWPVSWPKLPMSQRDKRTTRAGTWNNPESCSLDFSQTRGDSWTSASASASTASSPTFGTWNHSLLGAKHCMELILTVLTTNVPKWCKPPKETAWLPCREATSTVPEATVAPFRTACSSPSFNVRTPERKAKCTLHPP